MKPATVRIFARGVACPPGFAGEPLEGSLGVTLSSVVAYLSNKRSNSSLATEDFTRVSKGISSFQTSSLVDTLA